MNPRPPLLPFTEETALQKVQAAWNSRSPERVSLACTVDKEWRNRTNFSGSPSAGNRINSLV